LCAIASYERHGADAGAELPGVDRNTGDGAGRTDAGARSIQSRTPKGCAHITEVLGASAVPPSYSGGPPWVEGTLLAAAERFYDARGPGGRPCPPPRRASRRHSRARCLQRPMAAGDEVKQLPPRAACAPACRRTLADPQRASTSWPSTQLRPVRRRRACWSRRMARLSQRLVLWIQASTVAPEADGRPHTARSLRGARQAAGGRRGGRASVLDRGNTARSAVRATGHSGVHYVFLS